MQSTILHGRELAYREAGLAGAAAGESAAAGEGAAGAGEIGAAGEGRPTLLLIHGMAGSSHTWREMIPRLSQHFHVIAPDLPGHGQSSLEFDDYSLGAMASALRDLLVAKGVTRCTVIGQSLGGGVALQFVYQYPEFCERIALIGSGGLGREVSWILRLLAVPGAGFLVTGAAAPPVVNVGNSMRRFLLDRGVRAESVAESWAAFESLARPGHRRTFFKTLRAVVDNRGQAVSATNRLHLAAKLPVQVIWGDRDPIIPVSHGHATHEAIPGSRLAIVPGTGHYPHVEDPDTVERILVEFMASTEPGHIDHRALGQLVSAGSTTAS